ncbi:phosphotransferase [Paucisalibacillus globulus]|uniref:phosphotransferase n=1 Tax=Paucisalibacillus globulus TaxID=351095 RepID=UPI00040D1182|nr:phosphotransferase [Paucisalibacillus globulus]
MNGTEILSKFGFKVTKEPQSIYPFSPVYRVKNGNQDVIVKRTQGRSDSVMSYTEMLKGNGINVVTPVRLKVKNPQKIKDENFVVYPFIDGTVYSGKEQEIFEAGQLLGKIHSLSPISNTYNLLEYDVYDFNRDEVIESIDAISNHTKKANIAIDLESLQEELLESVAYQDEIQRAGLPHVATPHDYKANNLILTPDPYLIDPDNATWLPRIFDLALSLLLFHNEHKCAPARVFTSEEWETFLDGYKMYATLTEQEKVFWEKAMRHVFLDEVMWLMAEYEEDWQNPAQANLFRSLIEILLDGSDFSIG